MVRGDIDAVGGGNAWQKVECTEVVEVRRPFKAGSDVLAFVTLSSTLSLEEGPSPMNGNFSKGERNYSLTVKNIGNFETYVYVLRFDMA